MSSSKANVIEIINSIPNDMNVAQLVGRLYMLIRLEHSKDRCGEEGTLSDEDVALHFAKKKEQHTKRMGAFSIIP